MADLIVKHPFRDIAKGGGPTGYLYNLRAAAAEFGVESGITFDINEDAAAPPRPPLPPPAPWPLWKKVYNRLLMGYSAVTDGVKEKLAGPKPADFIPEIFDAELDAFEDWKEHYYGWITREHALKMFDADLLYANDIWLASALVKHCPELSREKLVLISHSPTWTIIEATARILPNYPDPRYMKIKRVRAIVDDNLETMASIRAVLWPCREAVPEYPEWVEANAAGRGANVFAETGVQKPTGELTAQQMRAQWKVESGQKVVLFIGRAHPHKGFHRFLSWANAAKKQGDNSYVFVHAGQPPQPADPDSPLRHVGYIKDNAAAYAAADLVVIPNQYSYMDIGLLESLSLGAKIAISPTGGHSLFPRICPEIPVIPDTDPTAEWNVLKSYIREYADTTARQDAFVRLWEQRFSLKPFCENHIRVVRELMP
jgi:glycosyltransferase involved in cell wall biosynthesis